MRPGLRLALSLLISILVFAGFAAAAFLGLFDLFDDRLYHPAVERQVKRSLSAAVAELDAWTAEKETLLGAALSRDSVRRSFLPEQALSDIAEREAVFARLREDPDGIEGARFIEPAALRRRIHFSTYPEDVASRSDTRIVYRDWGSSASDEDYALVEASADGKPRFIVPASGGRIYLSFPFQDAAGVRRGTALFSLRISALADRLTRAGVLRLSDDIAAVPGAGLVAKAPEGGRSSLLPLVAARWATAGDAEPSVALLAESEAGGYALAQASSASGIRYGFLVEGSAFRSPDSMKAILLGAFLLTTFLVVYLLFNLRQDPESAVRERIKRLQIGILEEYIDKRGELDYRRWSKELEARRTDVRAQIKASVGIKADKPSGSVDELIDKGWDEILDILGSRAARESEGPRLAEIESMMRRILASGAFIPPPGGTRPPTPLPPSGAEAPRIEAVEELAEAVPEVEAVEELPEAEAVEALAEAVEDLPEVEAVEELAEAVEELPEVEAVEELPEVEAVEELEEVQAVEELAEPELLEEVPEAEELGVLSGAEPGTSADEYSGARASEEGSSAGPFTLSPLAMEEEPAGIAPVRPEDVPEIEAPGADEVLSAWMKNSADIEEEVEYLEDEGHPAEAVAAEVRAESGPSPFKGGGPPLETAAPGAGAAEGRTPEGRTLERRRFHIRGASITENVESIAEITEDDLETLEEDWELSLAPLDLSALAGIALAGLGEGLDASGILVEARAAETARAEEEPEELVEITDSEIPMLSDAEREAVEELALADDDRAAEAPSDLIEVRGPVEPYVPFFARGPEAEVPSERLSEGEARLEEIPPGGEAAEGAADPVVRESDGIYYIAEGAGRPEGEGDPEFSSLVESVIGRR